MKNIKQCIELYVKQGYVNNIAIRAGVKEKILCDLYFGEKEPVDSTYLFDMASVTKIIATTSLALIAMDKKLFSVKDSVGKYLDVTDEKKHMTIYNLLTHTMGTGHKSLNIEGNNYDNIHNYILSLPSDVEIGSEVMYSCPGYILLGKIVEKVLGNRLDYLFEEYVARPLGMKNTTFLPDRNKKFVNSNLYDEEIGTVNDYNCRFLGGVAGNAGLFSNMEDVSEYVKMLLNYGAPIISNETFNFAIKNHTSHMSESRGLGFLYVDEKYKQTGKLFPKGSIGHCGHTGQSVFVDLKSGLYVVILSDATIAGVKKYGCEKYDVVMKMREDIHNAIHSDLKGVINL